VKKGSRPHYFIVLYFTVSCKVLYSAWWWLQIPKYVAVFTCKIKLCIDCNPVFILYVRLLEHYMTPCLKTSTNSFFPGVKRSRRSVDSPPLCSTEFKRKWSYTPNPPSISVTAYFGVIFTFVSSHKRWCTFKRDHSVTRRAFPRPNPNLNMEV